MPRCKEKTPYQDVIDGNFKTCPKCGYSYRVTIGAEFSSAMDSYAEGAISADEVVQEPASIRTSPRSHARSTPRRGRRSDHRPQDRRNLIHTELRRRLGDDATVYSAGDEVHPDCSGSVCCSRKPARRRSTTSTSS